MVSVFASSAVDRGFVPPMFLPLCVYFLNQFVLTSKQERKACKRLIFLIVSKSCTKIVYLPTMYVYCLYTEATFNNIRVISWHGESEYLEKSTDLLQDNDELYYIMLYHYRLLRSL
jgi:acyl-CoA synthetase (AMP-forming)/AMP-acid ligase II